MAKKTKVTQQRTKEEQWRRRVAAQTQAQTPIMQPRSGASAASSVMDGPAGSADDVVSEGYTQAPIRPRPSNVTTATSASASSTTYRPQSATRATSAAASAASTATPTAGQRRAIAAGRAARARITTNTMTVDEEMHYVRTDIRRLILLTAICLAVIIVLSFVIR